MTKKDYELIEGALFRARPQTVVYDFTDEMVFACHRNVCEEVANALQAANPKFDRTRFMRGCGVMVVNG